MKQAFATLKITKYWSPISEFEENKAAPQDTPDYPRHEKWDQRCVSPATEAQASSTTSKWFATTSPCLHFNLSKPNLEKQRSNPSRNAKFVSADIRQALGSWCGSSTSPASKSSKSFCISRSLLERVLQYLLYNHSAILSNRRPTSISQPARSAASSKSPR